MGRAGPKPKPIETLRLTGSKEMYEREGEPALIPGTPEPPDWLDDRGKAQWNRMIERMRGMQVLSPAWRESLAMFCEAWSEYEALVVRCANEEFVVYGRNDAPYANPLFGKKSAAWDKVLKMGREFGFTPASKADIRMETGPQAGEKGRFFKGAAS